MINRIFRTAFILLPLLACLILVCPAQEEYIIESVSDWNAYALLVNSGDADAAAASVTLMSDVNFQNTAFTPVGSSSNPFCGTFNGNGYAIKNVKITSLPAAFSSSEDCALGVFGYAQNARFENVTLDSINITLSNTVLKTSLYTGLLCGKLTVTDSSKNGIAKNCSAEGSIDIIMPKCVVSGGGLFGYVKANAAYSGFAADKCVADAEIILETNRFAYSGGICAYVTVQAADTFLSADNCYSQGMLFIADTSSFAVSGGIFGFAVYENMWSGSGNASGAATDEAMEYLELGANVTDSFSACEIQSKASEKYLGSIIGYTMTLTTKNIFCPQSKKTASSASYSKQGEAVSEYLNTIFNNGTYYVHAYVDGISGKATAVCAFYNQDGKMLGMRMLTTSGAVCTVAEFEEKPYKTSVMFFDSLSLDGLKPMTEKLEN